MADRRQARVLPRAISQWRKERGLSQKQLADKAAVSEGLIALIETGRRQPSVLNAVAIASVLGVSVHAIAFVDATEEELADLASGSAA